jgi:hypothetical protein
MYLPIAYIGPGIGLGTILLVLVVLLIVAASLLMILWVPLKKCLGSLSRLFSRK